MSSDEQWRPPSRAGQRAAFTTPAATEAPARTWTRPSALPAVTGTAIVETENLSRDYPVGDSVVHALKGIDLSVPRGQLVAIQGRSGSGKTSLLNLIGGLDKPTRGRVWIDGQEVTAMVEENLVQ